jgi:hypothetical protein
VGTSPAIGTSNTGVGTNSGAATGISSGTTTSGTSGSYRSDVDNLRTDRDMLRSSNAASERLQQDGRTARENIQQRNDASVINQPVRVPSPVISGPSVSSPTVSSPMAPTRPNAPATGQ